MLMRDLGLEVFHLLAEVLRHGTLMITEYSDGTIGTVVRQQLGSYWLRAFIYHIHTYIHIYTLQNSPKQGHFYTVCYKLLHA